MTNSTGSKIVLSPVPLTSELRKLHTLNSAVFKDLASLRRAGLSGALKELRSCGASEVIVTGDESDLAVFGDILTLMALAIPRAERWFVKPGLPPVRITRFHSPVSLTRLALGVACGFLALSANLFRLHQVNNPIQVSRSVRPVRSKCLYLKPALSFGLPVGGSIGHVAGIVNSMQDAGLDIRMMAITEQPLIHSNVSQARVIPHSLAAFPHELNRFRYHRKFSKEALKQIRDYKPDFIYQRYSLHDMTGICLRHKLGIPLILEYNGSETWIQRNWGEPLRFQSIAEKIEAANLKLADLVVVVSEEIKKQVCSVGVPEDRVLFYPNCVDPTVFDPDRFDAQSIRGIRQELGIPLDADLFTFIGTFGQWHGTEILARAIRHMVEHERTFLESRKTHFLLVGDGQYGESVRAMLKGLSFVSLPGYRPQHETPGILAASDVCLSPHVPNSDGTPFFGSPTKLFEYMALGKLIVASDLDQIGWVLRGWRPGDPAPRAGQGSAAAILVQPGDLQSLIGGIRQASHLPPSERQQLGNCARKLVLSSFTWERNVGAVLARFDRILAERRQNCVPSAEFGNNSIPS